MKSFIVIPIILASFYGHAAHPGNPSAPGTPAAQYSHYNCLQIANEMTEKNNRANNLYRELKEQDHIDDIHNAVAFIIVPPLVLLTNNKDLLYSREYARQKEERDRLISEWKVLKETAKIKNCNPAMIPTYVLPQPVQKTAGTFKPDNL